MRSTPAPTLPDWPRMPEAQIVLGAAVIDDVLGLVILAILSLRAVKHLIANRANQKVAA